MSQREREAMKDERTHHCTINRNNRSVLARRYSVLWEKIGTILLPLVGLTAGRQANEMRVGLEIFKILYRFKYSGFYFTAMLLQY